MSWKTGVRTSSSLLNSSFRQVLRCHAGSRLVGRHVLDSLVINFHLTCILRVGCSRNLLGSRLLCKRRLLRRRSFWGGSGRSLWCSRGRRLWRLHGIQLLHSSTFWQVLQHH